MTLENILKLSRYTVFGDETNTDYADTIIKLNTNKNYRRLEARAIMNSPNWQPRATYAYIDILADVYKYDLDSSIWRVNKIEAKFTSDSDYLLVNPINIDINTALEEYEPTSPEYDIRAGFLTLFTNLPIVNVTNGIKLYVQRDVTDLVNTTDEPDLVEPFVDLLALYNALDYCLANEMTTKGREIERAIDKRLIEFDEFMASRQLVATTLTPENKNYY